MSVYNDKQREEIKKAKLKQEQYEAELKGKNSGRYKNITEIKTLDELLEYYYIIPKIVSYEEYEGLNIREVLEQVTLKTRKPTNINLVRRGKRKKRISEEEQELIRNSKKTNAELSKIYNVSASTISNIKNNKY